MSKCCYECKYRGTIPGDAHSCCRYPGTATDILDLFDPQNKEMAKKLNINGDLNGIKAGQFRWPVNFDPVWLTNCDGFESKNKGETK